MLTEGAVAFALHFLEFNYSSEFRVSEMSSLVVSFFLCRRVLTPPASVWTAFVTRFFSRAGWA